MDRENRCAAVTAALALGLLLTACSDDTAVADASLTRDVGVGASTGDVTADVGPPLVEIDTGKLRGVRDDPAPGRQVIAFKGIPYAQAPVGDLRWKSPQAPQPWTGTRDATRYGAVCPQLSGGNNTWSAPEGEVFGAEDCLYLNVWTPSLTGGPYPVMVFLHGGGNNLGSSIQPLGDAIGIDKAGPPLYEGQRLAARGEVVVVTLNYRLGVLGFLIHPELAQEVGQGASGNWGLRDQIAALRWVQRNIAQFGGDPQRVTLFGQSGGARDTLALTVSPLAAGLFHRAIAHSPPWGIQPPSFFRPLQDAFIEELGCHQASSVVGCLRGKSVEAMVKAKNAQVLGMASFPFHPTVDGHVVPEAPPSAFANGNFNKVPFMVGTTEAEHSHWEQFHNLSETAFNALLAQLVIKPGSLPEAQALYDVARYGDYSSAYIAAFDDRGVTCSTVRNVAAVAANNTAPTYHYRFRQVLSSDKRLGFGAYHTSDLLFLFQHLDGEHFATSPAEQATQAAMLRYWTRFAATGDPTPQDGSLAVWKPHDAAAGAYQSLESTPSSQQWLKSAECAFWNTQVP